MAGVPPAASPASALVVAGAKRGGAKRAGAKAGGSIAPLVATTAAECSKPEGGTCAPKTIVLAVARLVQQKGHAIGSGGGAQPPPPEVMEKGAQVLGCNSEACVASHPAVVDKAVEMGAERAAVNADLKARFKTAGPRTGRGLVSNFNIDEVLGRWAAEHGTFFNCPYSMMDFEKEDYLFGRVDLGEVRAGKVTQKIFEGGAFRPVARPCATFGCVLNTDVSRGAGKHWVCVFVDTRGSVWTVEYFNSTGQPPPPAVTRWMENAAACLRRSAAAEKKDIVVKTVAVTDVAHQEGDTECGLYTLFYIRARLDGTPWGSFTESRFDDDTMAKFRPHVFSDVKVSD